MATRRASNSRIQPQELLIALPQEAKHCGLDATMLA
jgi:hypothetical protein